VGIVWVWLGDDLAAGANGLAGVTALLARADFPGPEHAGPVAAEPPVLSRRSWFSIQIRSNLAVHDDSVFQLQATPSVTVRFHGGRSFQ
jgi:hypothetical protein